MNVFYPYLGSGCDPSDKLIALSVQVYLQILGALVISTRGVILGAEKDLKEVYFCSEFCVILMYEILWSFDICVIKLICVIVKI